MYGRMQLADYLVSNALQINNACLQRLSELEGDLTSQDLRLFRAIASHMGCQRTIGA